MRQRAVSLSAGDHPPGAALDVPLEVSDASKLKALTLRYTP
jgi:hypothetical protein